MKRQLGITKKQLESAERYIPDSQKTPGWEERLQQEKIADAVREEQFYRHEAPIIHDLHEIGIPVTTIGKSYEIEPFKPFSVDAINVFLKWLPRSHPDIQTAIIGCLHGAKSKFDGEAITKAFDSTDNSSMRTQLAGLILDKMPHNIDNWLLHVATKGSDGFTRAILLRAAAKTHEFPALRDSAWQLFREIPDLMTNLLAKYGGEKDIAFLESRGNEFTEREKKSFAKAATKIRQRLAKPTQ